MTADSPPPPAPLLLVDDRPENLIALRAIVDAPDRTLVEATSGPDALAATLRDDFAVVLLDVQMPGMDGFEVAELLRGMARTRSLPILFVTAISREDHHVRRGYALGAVDYLFKPLEPEIVRSKVDVFVELWRQRQLVAAQAEALAHANAKLEESNRNLTDFAAVAAHDLRAPLQAIGLHVEMTQMLMRGQLSDEASDHLERILAGVDRMADLLQGLLEFSRLQADDLTEEPVALDAVVAEAFEALEAHRTDARATLLADPLPRVRGDARLLRQVVQNLVANGIKFHRDGVRPRVRVSAERGGDRWRITVEDNGRGMSDAACQRVFEPFYQAHADDRQSGFGLGLAACQRIVERHGGEIRATSQEGEGTRVTFDLAAVQA